MPKRHSENIYDIPDEDLATSYVLRGVTVFVCVYVYPVQYLLTACLFSLFLLEITSDSVPSF